MSVLQAMWRAGVQVLARTEQEKEQRSRVFSRDAFRLSVSWPWSAIHFFLPALREHSQDCPSSFSTLFLCDTHIKQAEHKVYSLYGGTVLHQPDCNFLLLFSPGCQTASLFWKCPSGCPETTQPQLNVQGWTLLLLSTTSQGVTRFQLWDYLLVPTKVENWKLYGEASRWRLEIGSPRFSQ